MPTNDFLPFCPTDTGTNLLTQTEYAAATDRTNGNQPGVASSKLNNKAVRQSAFITSQIAQYLADKSGADVLDGGSTATLLALINSVMLPKAPVIQTFLTGSGTFNRSYIFTIAAGNATVGATYTNNGVTYTVFKTVVAGTQLIAQGNNIPAVSGTLTKASGTGDATITFYAYQTSLYLRAQLVGGGGGGGGGAVGVAGGNGTATTFGTTLLSAGGGTGGGVAAVAGGVGGVASLGTGPLGIALAGGTGDKGDQKVNVYATGGKGGDSAFGGGGSGGGPAIAALSGAANTGGGGGGGSNNCLSATGNSGAGGGAGAFVDAVISGSTLAVTFPYVVGAGGALGTAGSTNGTGQAGGAGGSGVILVQEHFQ